MIIHHTSVNREKEWYFYPHEESHEGLGATVLQFQTFVQVSENLVSARF